MISNIKCILDSAENHCYYEHGNYLRRYLMKVVPFALQAGAGVALLMGGIYPLALSALLVIAGGSLIVGSLISLFRS
ncbi:hypothetical protein BH11PAT2_BH11PAT2_03940 [soil metagenome]